MISMPGMSLIAVCMFQDPRKQSCMAALSTHECVMLQLGRNTTCTVRLRSMTRIWIRLDAHVEYTYINTGKQFKGFQYSYWKIDCSYTCIYMYIYTNIHIHINTGKQFKGFQYSYWKIGCS
jgi:hypothetical protein